MSDAARGDADASSEAPEGALSAFCDLATTSVVPDARPIVDVLSGSSRNPSVRCAATPGPDAFYALEVSAFTIVDLRVDAPIETTIAVRSGCGGDAVEIACADALPSIPTDGGAASGPLQAEGGADAAPARHAPSLRVGLAAGRYTVIVDAVSPDLPATAFTLTATTVAPAANATCVAAATLDPFAPTAHGDLDLAGAPVVDCGGATSRALFYAIEVPSGQHLVARATATGGDRAWTPQLTAFDDCAATTCLARGGDVAGTEQRLDWINNGAAARLVILSVAADGPVVGGQLDLGAGLTDLLATCARPTPVVDGTTLINLDLADVAPSTSPTCTTQDQPALYFVATLRPQQELSVTTPTNGASVPIGVGLRSACDDDCEMSTFPAGTINQTSQPETVLIEVTASSMSTSTGPFDLAFSLPAPPAGIVVTPTSPLVTTEAGGQATFQVVLASDPTASVTVALSSSRPSEGTVSPPSLVFDATNWDQPQSVTVTGVEDDVGDGAQTYTIVTAPAVSADPAYAGLDADDLPLTNLDDDPSLVLAGTDDVVTSEDGTSATFTVRLEVAPTSSVTVPLASTDLGEGTVSPPTLTFTPASWSVPQAVTVTGVDDVVADGAQRYAITLGPLATEDARYAGVAPASVVAFNRDNDFAPVAGTVVSGAASCATGSTPNQFPLAIDALGALYAVALCDGALALFTSPDGGATITGPVPVPGATNLEGAFAVAADRGRAWVAFEGGRGLQLARTTDAGRTWSLRTLTSDTPVLLRMAAARDTVVITGTDTSDASGGSLVLVSEDGGLSFARRPNVGGQMTALALSGDGASIWLVDDVPNLLRSLDGGATFTLEGASGGTPLQCCYLAGTHDLYDLQREQVSLTDLADGTNDGSFAGPASPPLAAAIDDTDVVRIFTIGRDGLDASRFGADDTLGLLMPAAAAADAAGAATLARHATAIVTVADGQILFTTAVWP
ncbi:MAG TPA: hypothetical protein VLA14_18180 [Polyangia bacterium]|nr:hypothetical protein [Polyangia bacterium]